MKTRRILCLLCLLSMIFSLCSCSVSKNPEIQSNISAETQTTTTKAGTTATKHTTVESKPKSGSESKLVSVSSTTKATKAVSSKTTTEKTASKNRTEKKVKSTTAATALTSATEYCTVTIECKSVLDNINSLKPGHSEYVPESGYILLNYKCSYQPNLTAYDLLAKSCDENGIKLTANRTSYGTYLKGINNLDEFDCGNESGWLYYVNGKKPPVSCDKYTVSSGDEIVFSYTCDY